jgi:hypothetical protein
VDITFDAPHVLQAGSPPAESACPILRDCLRGLRKNGKRASVERTAATQVTWHLPDVFNAGSVPVENASSLQALVQCLTDLDKIYLRDEPSTPLLYESGVYYARTEVWDTTPALYYKRRKGDCKSLACTLAAERELGLGGYDPEECQVVFRFLPHKSGPLHVTYHVLNLTPRGWEDPSKACGMTDNENSYFRIPQ